MTSPFRGEGGCYTNIFLVGTGPPWMVWLPVALIEQCPWCHYPSQLLSFRTALGSTQGLRNVPGDLLLPTL